LQGLSFESYLLKLGKIREKLGDTLEQAFPQLAALATVVAAKLKAILAMICPLAVLLQYDPTPPFLAVHVHFTFSKNCISHEAAQQSGVPVFKGTGTTAMYNTRNYTTAAHRDCDIGSCQTLAVFLEEHKPGCQRSQCA
jgi:ABC-type uncharacterized transport system YnjBCD permease subunit